MAQPFYRRHFRLKLRSRTLALGGRTLIMGVLNVTPDSFSDGGHYLDPERAIDHALQMDAAGADIIDIGGESTRPGSEGISSDQELKRVLPVVRGLGGKLRAAISIDTSKSQVARAAIEAGAEILNDVTGLMADPELAQVAAQSKLPLILVHMRGRPRTMQKLAFASDVMRDVLSGLRRSIAIAERAGVLKSQIVLDPGLGFGKSYAQNYELIAGLPRLARLGFPLLVGASRKSFVGKALGGRAKADRAWGTAATVAGAAFGGAHIVRVHEVQQMLEVARVADAIVNRGREPKGPVR